MLLSVTATWLVPFTITLLARAVTLAMPVPSPTKKLAVATFPRFELPELETFKLLKVPKVVIFGCAAVVNVPVNKLAPIVPAFAYILAVVVTFPEAVSLPVETLPEVRLPVAVIVLLDEIELLATNALAVTVPEKLALVIPVILAGKSTVSD